MLKRKLSTFIIAVTVINFSSTPLSVFANTLTTNTVIQESQEQEKKEIKSGVAKVSKFEPYYSKAKDAYNELFKMNNSNIEKVYANGNYLNYYSTIENMTDGNLDTYWETAKVNSDSFENEVIFTLKESTILNRIAYKAAFNTVGFAENFEIWGATTNEDIFQLVATGSTTKTTDLVEFKFTPTEFKKIKFVYKSAYQNKATASEFMFYKEDAALDKVNRLFTDNTMSEVSEEFNSIDKVDTLEEEFKLHPLYSDFKDNIDNAKALVKREEVQATEAKVSNFGVSDKNLATYNEQFKISRDEIIKASNTGGTSNQTKIENVLDGDLNTFWESGKVNTSTYNNEVEFEFDQIKTINRIVYSAKRGTNRGFAQEFEIYASPTTVGDTFKLISKGTATATQDTLEFKFKPTEIKRIKFVYKKSVESWAAASEFAFYKEDTLRDKVESLFTDSTMAVVSKEFNTVDNVNALEEEFKLHPLYQAYKEDFENAKILINEKKIVATETKVSKFDIYYSENKDSYDKAFKMENSNVESIYTNGGHLNNSIKENMLDGRLDTYWESGTQNGNTFKNEIIFTLKEATVLNRIAYSSAWNTVGFAEAFEIWASSTSVGNTFQLVSTGLTIKTADVVEFKFEPTNFKRIKFVFKSGYSNKATASEVMFYKEDAVFDKINTIFTDNTFSKVSEEFNAIEKVNLLEKEIINHPLKDQLQEKIDLAKSIINGEVDFSNNIFTLKQYGDVVSHIRNDLKMSSFGTNLQSTGIVAIPGEVFNIYVEAEDGKPLPKIAFTQQEGSYSNWQRSYILKKGMNTIVVPEIYSEGWSKKSNKGGAVYLINPYTPENQGKAPIVRIEGGEHFPLFNEGDNKEEFLEELKVYKEKLAANPNTMVDIFEFNAERLMFTGTTSGAYKVYVDEGVDIDTSVNVWDEQLELGIKFAGLSDNSEDIKNDSTNIRTTIRLMQPFGAAYAASDHIGLQRGVMEFFLRTDKYYVNDIIWGTMHEVGHQMDIPARTWGEVSNNMWPNYAAILNGKGDRINYEDLYKVLAPQDGKRQSEDVILEMFWQLQLANENYWPSLEKMYREKNPTVANYQEKKDTLAKYSSEILGMNLTPYFEKYNFTLSDECKAELSKLPEMDKKLWYLNTTAMNYTGNGFNDNLKVEISSLKNDSTKGIILTFAIDESNKDNLLGYEIIRDGKVIGFTSKNTFTDSNVDVNENYKYEVMAYARDLSRASVVETQSKTPNLLVNEKITLKVNEEFNPLNYVNAIDSLGNTIEEIKVTNNVDTTKKGLYNLSYEVVSNGITVKKDVVVEVVSYYDYLSDSEWVSATTDYSLVRKNNDLKLLVNGKVQNFAKGFGIHANGEIVYDLSGKNYDKFEALVGVSRSISEQNNSSIIFTILADGNEVYNSGLMKYSDLAKFVSVDVNGVKELKIVINDGGNGIASDHGVIASPIVTTNNSKPELNIPKSVSTKIGYPIDLNEDYSAIDVEDGDLTKNIEVIGEVNFDKTGEYVITYKVTDSDGNIVSKTRTVAVVDMNDYTYLTDFNWKSESHSYSAPKKDVATSSKALRLTDESGKEVVYTRGIGAHSNSTIIYDLSDKNYDYFTSYVGVDRQMYGSIGSVSFEVYVDGEKKFDSGLMNSKDLQKYIEVDINGAKELKLVVTDGGNGNGSDHATWGDTKLHYANENGISIKRAELDILIKEVTELDSKIYTEESFNNLKLVLENVKTNLLDGYNQEEIDNLYNNLKEAYDSLVKPTDFSILQEVIDNNSNLNELHYYKDAITAHKAIIEEAKKVLANENSTQEEIDTIVAKVNESSKNLVIRQNKVELENKIKESELVENNNYDILRWGNFRWAIEYSMDIYNNIDSTDENIESALFSLEYFKGELK